MQGLYIHIKNYLKKTSGIAKPTCTYACKYPSNIQCIRWTRLLKCVLCFQPLQLISYSLDIAKPGKLPGGRTEIPFELPLKPKGNKELYETYHGVFVNIQVMNTFDSITNIRQNWKQMR